MTKKLDFPRETHRSIIIEPPKLYELKGLSVANSAINKLSAQAAAEAFNNLGSASTTNSNSNSALTIQKLRELKQKLDGKLKESEVVSSKPRGIRKSSNDYPERWAKLLQETQLAALDELDPIKREIKPEETMESKYPDSGAWS